MDEKLIAADSAIYTIKKLLQNGFSLNQILESTGLEKSWAQAKDAVISYEQYRNIVLNGYHITGDPALGLNLHREITIAEFGMQGYAFMSSSTLGLAIKNCIKFWELAGQLLTLEVEEGNDFWNFYMYPAHPIINGQCLIYAIEECLLTNTVFASTAVNRPILPSRIEVVHPSPTYANLYLERLGCEVEFESAVNRYSLDSKYMELPIVTSQPQTAEFCIRQCNEILSRMTGKSEFINRVREILLNPANRLYGVDELASHLEIGSRTLHRKLSEENTTFRSVLDEVRMELAKNYLKGTRLTIEQIAEMVGYTEPTSFRRAFKKWTGLSPKSFRLDR